MRRIWADLLTSGEAGALAPGVPDDLDRRPDVLVVGGGVIGLATAVACRRAGLGRVLVVERAEALVPGASGSNAGAIAPDMHLLTDGAEFVAFGRASREIYRAWDSDWGGAIGLWPTRWLNVFPPGANPLVTRQPSPSPARSWSAGGPPEPPGTRSGHHKSTIAPAGGFRVLDRAEVAALEPDVHLADGGSALLVDQQLGVNPQRLATALATRAGQIATGVAMTGVTVRGDRIAVVHTTAGDLSPGSVVIATGLVPEPWSAGVRQRWIKGHMLAVGPGPWRLGSVLAGPLGGGTPLADGSIVCGGTFDEHDQTHRVRPEIAGTLADGLRAVLPAARDASITHRWYCFRPYIDGRQPVVDRLPGASNGWFAGGHFTTGVMMAAATGTALAAWIASGTAPAGIAGFDLPFMDAGAANPAGRRQGHAP